MTSPELLPPQRTRLIDTVRDLMVDPAARQQAMQWAGIAAILGIGLYLVTGDTTVPTADVTADHEELELVVRDINVRSSAMPAARFAGQEHDQVDAAFDRFLDRLYTDKSATNEPASDEAEGWEPRRIRLGLVDVAFDRLVPRPPAVDAFGPAEATPKS